MFFIGEDEVAEALSSYIHAAPTPEQKYFLATQQADEVRHAILFSRFFSEVVGTGESLADRFAACRPYLTWGFVRLFERLDRISSELWRDRSPSKFAQAIALYHILVEGGLAQPGQHLIQDHVLERVHMPGMRAGIEQVIRDEQRHIAFGVKVLSELVATNEECKAAVAEMLQDVLRYSLAVFLPPGWNRGYAEQWGFTMEQHYAKSFRAVEDRFRSAGLPLDELPPRVLPIDRSLSHEERAAIVLRMLDARLIGEPGTSPDTSREAQRLLFDMVVRSLSQVNLVPRLQVQWRFYDAAPWHVSIDDHRVEAHEGEADTSDVTLESSWQTWVELAGGHLSTGRALLSRRLSIRGRPAGLWRLRQLLSP